jgi:tripartite-type tricarboxylate transporter receptor subunit TctC
MLARAAHRREACCRKAVALGGVGAFESTIRAQPATAWPERPPRIVIPWAPGGSTDIVTRILGADISKRLGQPVLIENRAGGGAIVGMDYASQLPADDHNFMLTSTGYGFLINKAKVDLTNSFALVSLIGFGDSALVVHPKLPVNAVKELIEMAKRRPGEHNYSSSGVGGFPHMNTELFKMMAGIDLTHIPFKGGGPAIADTAAGNTQLQIGSLPTVISLIRSGRLKVLAVGGPKRNPALPNVPTISESGVPGYETYIWFGLFAPRSTPPDLIAHMHTAVMTSLDAPDVVKRLEEQGVDIDRRSTAAFAKLMIAETEKWARVIKAASITGE